MLHVVLYSESPAITVSKLLLDERAKLSIYDPQVEANQIKHDFEEYSILDNNNEFDQLVTIERDPYKSVDGSHAICVLTEW